MRFKLFNQPLNPYKTPFRWHGFTLIELLVVISIIGALIALSLVGLQESRKSARDARRKADLQTLASAFELYKADCNYYPYDTLAPGTQITDDTDVRVGVDCNANPTGTNIYLQSIPDDPLATRDYEVVGLGCDITPPIGNCTRYELYAALESDPGPLLLPCDAGNLCGDSSCNYCIYSP